MLSPPGMMVNENERNSSEPQRNLMMSVAAQAQLNFCQEPVTPQGIVALALTNTQALEGFLCRTFNIMDRKKTLRQ